MANSISKEELIKLRIKFINSDFFIKKKEWEFKDFKFWFLSWNISKNLFIANNITIFLLFITSWFLIDIWKKPENNNIILWSIWFFCLIIMLLSFSYLFSLIFYSRKKILSIFTITFFSVIIPVIFYYISNVYLIEKIVIIFTYIYVLTILPVALQWIIKFAKNIKRDISWIFNLWNVFIKLFFWKYYIKEINEKIDEYKDTIKWISINEIESFIFERIKKFKFYWIVFSLYIFINLVFWITIKSIIEFLMKNLYKLNEFILILIWESNWLWIIYMIIVSFMITWIIVLLSYILIVILIIILDIKFFSAIIDYKDKYNN